LEVDLTGFPTEAIGLWMVLVWFAIETYWDIRRSTLLPIGLVLPPVVLGIAAQAAYGQWLIAGAALLMVLMHNASMALVRTVGTALAAGACLYSGNIVLAIGFVLYWALWEFHIMGGADALAAYAALMIAPNQLMFWTLLAGILIWASAVMVIVYRGKLVARMRTMVWRMMLKDLPKESEFEAEGQPTLGGLFLGVAFYLIWTALGLQ
jgi:hypothetical protein